MTNSKTSTRPAIITDYVLPPSTIEPLSTSSPTSTPIEVICPSTLYQEPPRKISIFPFEPSRRAGDISLAEKQEVKYEFLTVGSSPFSPNVKTSTFSSPSCLLSTTQTSSNNFSNIQTYNQHRNKTIENNRPQYFIQSSHYCTGNSGNYQDCNDLISINGLHLNSMGFEPDINNNNSDISCPEQNFFDPSSDYSGSIISTDTNEKINRLPPFRVLLPSSPGKQGISETSRFLTKTSESMFDDTDEMNFTSSSSSIDDDPQYIDLTNVGQQLHENDLSCMAQESDINFPWPDHEFNYKLEPPEYDCFHDPFHPSFDSPPDSEDYDSSSPDRPNFNSSSTTGSDCTACNYLPTEEDPFRHSVIDQESESTDEGYHGGLPDFDSLEQGCRDLDKGSPPKRNRSLSLKNKKKTVKESQPYVEKERRKPGRKPGQVSNVLHLWEFIRDLLQSSENQGIIEWICKADGVFRVINSQEVARLWGAQKKNKKTMTYEKLSRSIRYSRLEGYFAELPTDKQYPKKLCFKFGPRSKKTLEQTTPKTLTAPS